MFRFTGRISLLLAPNAKLSICGTDCGQCGKFQPASKVRIPSRRASIRVKYISTTSTVDWKKQAMASHGNKENSKKFLQNYIHSIFHFQRDVNCIVTEILSELLQSVLEQVNEQEQKSEEQAEEETVEIKLNDVNICFFNCSL